MTGHGARGKVPCQLRLGFVDGATLVRQAGRPQAAAPGISLESGSGKFLAEGNP
jgi:hypothetical protein